MSKEKCIALYSLIKPVVKGYVHVHWDDEKNALYIDIKKGEVTFCKKYDSPVSTIEALAELTLKEYSDFISNLYFQ